ncbi:MAG TPA: DNA mismatch repair endonuclease MutL [Burkholderiales bacterium]|nr:DNA mismatch repair endonuclease MutL [Burkholderiales bacterium]
MNKIHVLAAEVAQKIAAGEVIERPVSVVKELVENSLDAGATDIRVELVEGGKRLIKVQDNGSGMSREDAALCFRRHSTSKISSEDDLERITTLGFRGEALASIAAVSKLTLRTHDGAEDRGTMIEREGEKLVSVTDIALPRGTTVEVRDLFFNLPARRKFLRSNSSELGLIAKYVTQAALARPGTRFVLLHGTREIVNCPPVGTLRERIFQLYGKAVIDDLMEVASAEGEGRLSGFASKPLRGRLDRSVQVFFVNGRPIKDRVIQAALSQAYAGLLERGRSPEAFLFIDLPYGEVDVNVHPAKAEVRFRESQLVFRLVLRAVETAAQREHAIKAAYPVGETTGRVPGIAEGGAEPPGLGFGPLPEVAVARGTFAAGPAGGAFATSERSGTGPEVIGQFHGLYIIAAAEDGLLVVDQHNAHERVLFERYKEIDREKVWPRKMLLIPVVLELSPSQAVEFEENASLFEEMGFRAEPMGGRSYALKEHPDIFRAEEAAAIFLALLAEAGQDKARDRREQFLATLACKTAIKAGQPLTREKMGYLVSELFKTSQPALCPHGRPIVVKIGRAELDKRLGRRGTESSSDKQTHG